MARYYAFSPARLKELRREQGWSGSKLARLIETPDSYLNRLETGKHEPKASMVCRMAHALGVNPADLFVAVDP